ncbi:GNAT family N-acetyltransferase [Flavisolibacter sp. BT320]|nr:GNAT family N-acetyltransferase [Flavisolibacter longurius]
MLLQLYQSGGNKPGGKKQCYFLSDISVVMSVLTAWENCFQRYFRRMVSFFRMGPTDADLLAKVGSTSLLESHGHSAPAEIMQQYVESNFSLAACEAELTDDTNIFTAVVYNNVPVGYSKLILRTPHPAVNLQPVTKLERLYLLKEYYDHKLGHQLLREAISLSRESGERGMWLDVWKENHRAIRFYQKQGFETVGESSFVLTETRTNPIWVLLRRYEALP